MRRRMRFLVPFMVAGLVVAACSSDEDPDQTTEQQDDTEEAADEAAAADEAPVVTQDSEYPRQETLYTSGTQWGPPSNWNPIREWDFATGTKGLVYETLFFYDPLEDEFIPWLAEDGEWTGDTEYVLTLRDGVTWADGEPFTADDVVYTFELGQFESVPYSQLWTWLDSAEAVDDTTVRFTFSEANYQQWANALYSRAIVPQHIWDGRSEEEVLDGANENPVGTGAYEYHTHDQDRMVWVKRDGWWATEALGLEVAPTYIVDIVNSSNEVAMGLLLQQGLDLSNNFLPGIANLVGGEFGISTYYPDAPYMLSANTAWLVLNTTREPMDDPEFRRAIAHSVDTGRIVESVYGNIVQAADPTGLLPQWEQYIDQSVVNELGFSYDPDEARQILADAGYEDVDGDGYVETPDGEQIDLSIIVPSGWTDWMESIRVIAENVDEIGVRLTPSFPADTELIAARQAGDFDMLINNERQLTNTPWMYYDYIFRLPIQEQQSTVNFGRYENEEAWQLVRELDGRPVDDVDGMLEVTSQLQEIFLTEMPVIPLWYNGLWSQVSNSVWTNWPGADGDAPKFPPTTWRNWWEMGGLLTLTELQPAAG